MNNRLIKSNDAGGGGCTNTVDLYNPFPDGGGVALYQLNGDATDVSGNYDGTATNVTYGTGQFGQAGLFSTSTSKVLLPQTYGAEGETFSYSFWFNTTTNGTSVYDSEFIINKRNGANTFQINITDGGKLLVSDWRGTPLNAQSTTTVTDGTWRNVVFTYDNSIGKVYINGVQETSMNFTNDLATQSITNGNCLGNFDLNSRAFSGSLDQVRIFSRALRPYEVEALYTEEYCTPTIVPSEHFNTVTYTGTGVTNSVTGVGFQPDMVWAKSRSTANWHMLCDSVRGLSPLFPNATDEEGGPVLVSYDSDGFTTTSNGTINGNGNDLVAWNFKAGGSAVTNTDGTITSQVSANTEAGFSIVTFTGNGATASVGHGLGQKPSIIFTKNRSASEGWFTQQYMYVPSGNAAYGYLNTTAAFVGFTDSLTDDTVMQQGGTNGQNYVSYCFAEVEGFSSIGLYVGNGSVNTIVTGFEPAFVILKRTDTSGYSWAIADNKRIDGELLANVSDAERIENTPDFLENGFRLTTERYNDTGSKWIYMAFAADPTTVEPTLEDSFNTVVYSGDGTTNPRTDVGFQPDLTWVKGRSSADNHFLNDSVRGAGYTLYSNLTSQETLPSADAAISSFDSNGFTLSSSAGVNRSGSTYVAWNWKGAEIPAINSNGSIPSVVSANPAAGFSIVKYSGGSAGSTVGHALDSAPEIMIVKRLDSTSNWSVNGSVGGLIYGTNKLSLNLTDALGSDTNEITAATSSVFTIGGSGTTTGNDHIAYCFHSVAGFSKIGSYVGELNSKFVQTDFTPMFVLIKRTDSSVAYWMIFDNVRGASKQLNPNLSNAEYDWGASPQIQFDLNGFTLTTNNAYLNGVGGQFIYMAFADQF